MKNEKAMGVLKGIAENPNKGEKELQELTKKLIYLSDEYIATKNPQVFGRFLETLFILDKLYETKREIPDEIYKIVANVFGFISKRLENSNNKHFSESEEELEVMSMLQQELHDVFISKHMNGFLKFFKR